MDICKVSRYIFAFSLVISLYLIQTPENVLAKGKHGLALMDEVLVDPSSGRMDTYDVIRGQNRRTQRSTGKANKRLLGTIAALATTVLLVAAIVKYRHKAIDTLSGMMKSKGDDPTAVAVVMPSSVPLPPVGLPWHRSALYALVRWGNKLSTLSAIAVSAISMYLLYTGAILATTPMVIPAMITLSIILGLMTKLIFTINVPGVRKRTALLLSGIIMVVLAGFATQYSMGPEAFAGHYNSAVSKVSDLFNTVYGKIFGVAAVAGVNPDGTVVDGKGTKGTKVGEGQVTSSNDNTTTEATGSNIDPKTGLPIKPVDLTGGDPNQTPGTNDKSGVKSGPRQDPTEQEALIQQQNADALAAKKYDEIIKNVGKKHDISDLTQQQKTGLAALVEASPNQDVAKMIQAVRKPVK